jgi:UDP:flavonoid glycosyltransferase YjiC (YdhE family)
MPDVDLVIGHGGHSTAMRALSYDLPMLLMPMHPMVDQPTVARVIAADGAALTLPRTAAAADIRDAVQHLVTDPGFRIAAAALGTQIRERDGAAAASEYLRALALGHRDQSVPV